MKSETKLFIFKIIIFLAIAFIIVSCFTPLVSWDQSLFRGGDKENYDYYYKIDYAPILTEHYTVYSVKDPNVSSVYHMYSLLYFFSFDSGDDELKNCFNKVTDYTVKPVGILSVTVSKMVYLIFLFIWLFLLIFYFNKGMKDIGDNKSRDLLYISLINLLFLTLYLLIIFFMYFSRGKWYFGMRLEYGFYLFVLGIVLFFSAFILQKYFIDFSKNLNELD